MEASDIKELLDRMKDDAWTFEETGSTKALARLSETFLGFAELAKLFLISERDSYYGYCLMSMSFEPQCESRVIAGIKLDHFPPVFVSDPLLLSRFELKEVLYIFCHEIDHVIYNHPMEMRRAVEDGGEDDAEIFNLAADAAVNDMLNLEISQGRTFLRQPKGIVTSRYLGERFQIDGIMPCQSYRYYFDLLKEAGVHVGNQNAGVAAIPPDRHGDTSLFKNQSGRQGKEREPHVDVEHSGVIDHAWSDDSSFDGEALSSALRKLINDACTMMSEEARSHMPQRFVDEIARINKPARIPWQSMLKRYVGTMIAGKRKTRSRLNRRQPLRYDLPGALESKTIKLVVAIDTSASMGEDDLACIFNEVFTLLARRKYDLTVIECDTEIQRVYKARGISDIDFSIQGRGGTAYSPVIEYVNERRDLRGCLLVYFTDGFGERAIPRPKAYKTLWVILDDEENLSVANPFGTVVPLKI